MASLNPDNVLKRGYVRVTGANGQTLVSMAQAGGESSLTLHFRDGELGVVPADAAAPPRPAPRRVSRGEAPGQEDLFG